MRSLTVTAYEVECLITAPLAQLFINAQKNVKGKSFLYFIVPRHVARNTLGASILGAQNKNLIRGSCIPYYAYRDIIAVKMVFVRFEGRTNLG